MRRLALAVVLLTLACSRETHAPATATQAPVPVATGTASAPTTVTSTNAPQATPAAPSYQKSIDWLRTTRGFHFVIDVDDIHGEGDLFRTAIGAERIRVTMKEGTWIAAAKPEGVVWFREERGTRARTATPDGGDRLWQRVTIAFDPQKKEGAPLFEDGHFRFTDANTGNTHQVWVNARGQVERITIDGKPHIQLTITHPDAPAVVPEV
ncbi:MAG TPA: hypothetical protein VFN10_02380 [Thermoanaerobaculia bacterium]|nr:hypothetical protein [Thermoanaerobaculia bacterium]